MNPMQRIHRAHTAIMQHDEWCAYGPLLAYGETRVDTDTPTAYTDGVNKVYGARFIETLSDPELRFVVLHEASHIAYQHCWVWRDLSEENGRLANVAMDHFINLALVQTDAGKGFIVMPKIGIQPEDRFSGMSVKQIYNILKQEPEQGDQPQEGFDQHDFSGKPGEDTSPGAQEAQANEVGRLVRQGVMVKEAKARSRGKGTGNSAGVFEQLLAPKVDWRKYLRDFLTEQYSGKDESSWARPNRRMLALDIYMPSLQGKTLGDMVIGFDTSGSCFGTKHMTKVVSELTYIIEELKPERVHVVYWDTAVVGAQTFEQGTFAVQNLEPRGGGGTDGGVLFDWLRSKRINPQAIIQFTDGEVGDWGRSDWPTLWAITTKVRAPFGTTLNIGD